MAAVQGGLIQACVGTELQHKIKTIYNSRQHGAKWRCRFVQSVNDVLYTKLSALWGCLQNYYWLAVISVKYSYFQCWYIDVFTFFVQLAF